MAAQCRVVSALPLIPTSTQVINSSPVHTRTMSGAGGGWRGAVNKWGWGCLVPYGTPPSAPSVPAPVDSSPLLACNYDLVTTPLDVTGHNDRVVPPRVR
ncbi:hypothetical protein J6590_044068 [Homalodisca vitripennis]|nr:hypothetical protein J6590_044068 [Homalodisca vitripennis]